MSDIKIQLESPWKYSSGGIGKDLIENSPEEIEYIYSESKKIIHNKNLISKSRKIKNFLKISSLLLPLIKLRKVKILDKDVSLIHCEHFLCNNKKIPWVVDIEGMWQLFIGKKTKRKKKKIIKILLRRNCKKIITWTKTAEEELKKNYPELKNKVDTVYPAVPIKRIKRKNKKEITLLFVGRTFYQKGGFHALEAMDLLTKKYQNVNAIYVGEIPDKEKKEYSKNKRIKILGLISNKKLLEEVYPNSDILIYPGYNDSFGFAYLEAMSFGIPIVTINKYNTQEIVTTGKTGFLVDYDPKKIYIRKIGENEKKLIKRFCTKIEKLIEDPQLRKNMSKECVKIIKEGRFSVKERNEKIKRIYGGALE